MASNETTGTFVAGFVVGGLIGTAIAQIFAPQSGAVATDVRRMPWRELNVRTKHVHKRQKNASRPQDGSKQ